MRRSRKLASWWKVVDRWTTRLHRRMDRAQGGQSTCPAVRLSFPCCLYYATKESIGHWMIWCCVWCHRCPAHRPIDPSIGTSLLKRSRLCLPLSPLAHAAVVPPCRRVERRPRPCRVRMHGWARRTSPVAVAGACTRARGARITSLGLWGPI